MRKLESSWMQQNQAVGWGRGGTLPGTDSSRWVEEAEAQLRINVLEMKAAKSDHTDCRIPPKPSKHSGRLGVTPYRGLERVEIVSLDICKGNSDNGKTKGRPFCVTPVTSTTTVHVMGTGPLLHGSGCPATKMDTYVLWFSLHFL